MLIAMDTRRTIPFSLPEDTSEPRTVFHLGFFDTLLRAYLEEKYVTGDSTTDKRAFMIDCVRYGLRGWENLSGLEFVAEEERVPGVGPRQRATDETLNGLRLEWLVQIGSEVVKLNFLSKDAAKN